MAAASASPPLPLSTFLSIGRNLTSCRHPVFFPPTKASTVFRVSSLGNDGDRGGSGGSGVSPTWLNFLARSINERGDESGIPAARPRLEDVPDLLGGALFLPLYKWMLEYGPVYRLAAGPRDFVIISDPAAAKHVLRSYGSKYSKGLVSEVSEFLFGSGFAIAEGQLWTVRRRAVLPSLHRKFLSVMVDKVFCRCALKLVEKLGPYAKSGASVNMEEKFSQMTLDVIGLSLFNYNFDSLTSDSPVIAAVYTALKEAEARSTDILPFWKVDLRKIIPRQIKAERAVALIRNTVEELIAQCKEIVEAEGEQIEGEDYVNDSDPSILRFLLAARDEVWEGAEDFVPERFDLDGPVPNETNTDFRFIPFSGGPRKCVGDQFALLEAIIALAIIVQKINFELVPDQKINMTTGATIHTTNGLHMTLSPRNI